MITVMFSRICKFRSNKLHRVRSVLSVCYRSGAHKEMIMAAAGGTEKSARHAAS